MRQKKNVEHCLDCRDYPCGFITGSHKMDRLLPHLKANHANMERIRQEGVREWLSEQEKSWKCPECGAGFSWYAGRCVSCGKNLKKHAYAFTFLQFMILRLGIMLMPQKKK